MWQGAIYNQFKFTEYQCSILNMKHHFLIFPTFEQRRPTSKVLKQIYEAQNIFAEIFILLYPCKMIRNVDFFIFKSYHSQFGIF